MHGFSSTRFRVAALAALVTLALATGTHPTARAGLTASIRKATGKARGQLQQGQKGLDKVDKAAARTDSAAQRLKVFSTTASAESALNVDLGLSDSVPDSPSSRGSSAGARAPGGRAAGGTGRGSQRGGAAKGSASGGAASGVPPPGAGTGGTPPAGVPPAGTTAAGASGGRSATNTAVAGRRTMLRIVELSPAQAQVAAGSTVEWRLGLTSWDMASNRWVAPSTGTGVSAAVTVMYGMAAKNSLTLMQQQLSPVSFSGSATAFSAPGMSGECIPAGTVTFALPACAVQGVKLTANGGIIQGAAKLYFATQSRVTKSAQCQE